MTQDTAATDAVPTRQTRNTKTRPALHAALLELLDEQTLDQITVRSVTDKAGVGYATFFRHYADIDALLHDVTAGEIQQLLAMTLPIVYTIDSRSSAQALCAFVWGHRALWTALLTGGAGSTLKDEFVKHAKQLAAQDPKPHARVPSELRILVPITSTIEMLAWWLKQTEPVSVQRMAELLDIMVVQPAISTATLLKSR